MKELLIKLPDKVYEQLIKYGEPLPRGNHFDDTIMKAVANGTPLPKGHGRIGDLDKILIWLIYKKGIIDELKCGEVAPIFKDATIIEAESEVKEC